MKLVYQYMAISRTETAIRGLYIVDEDDNGKFRLERVRPECRTLHFARSSDFTSK